MRDRYEILRNDSLVLRHHPDPAPLLGWFLVESLRHFSGPIEFTTAEASAWLGWGRVAGKPLGATAYPVLSRLCHRLWEVAQHLHLHLIP